MDADKESLQNGNCDHQERRVDDLTTADDDQYLSTTCYNPSVPDDEINEYQLDRMKGDAIGNTLYSERFVLSTLLKLANVDKEAVEEEVFEKDLCSLWDMTIEKDVVLLLLEHNVLELFLICIEALQEKRLTEILVGIMGNMCNVEETRKELCRRPDLIGKLLELIASTDHLILIQLMRLLTVALVCDGLETASIWYQQILEMPIFVEHFAFILQNSVNVSLLTNSMEALNAMLAKFAVIDAVRNSQKTFCDTFVHESLVRGTFETFKILAPDAATVQEGDAVGVTEEGTFPSPALRKTMQIFLNIHVILTQFKKRAKRVYQPLLKDLLGYIAQILQPLCAPHDIMACDSNELVESVDEISLALGDPFDEICFAQMVVIWELTHDWIKDLLERQSKEKQEEEELHEGDGRDCEQDEDTYSDDMCMTVLYYINRMIRKSTVDQLRGCMGRLRPQTVKELIGALSAGKSEDDINECCQKLNDALKDSN